MEIMNNSKWKAFQLVLLQGYATDMALVEWNYSIFSGVWHKLGYGWDDFLAWVENELIPEMKVSHA